MEDTDVTEPEITPVPDAPEPDLPEPEVPEPDVPEPDVVPGTPAPDAVPAYQPNYKFKVLDKELEMPDWAKGAVDSPEKEAELREVMEKVHGFEHIKQSRNEFAQRAQQAGQQAEHLRGAIQGLAEFVRKGDLAGFFNELKIPEQAILEYARQVQMMTPEQRQVQAMQRDYQARMAAVEAENSNYRSQVTQQAGQQRAQEVDIYMARPDVSSAAQAYDARAGKPGAFREEVYNRGALYWHQFKKDIPVEQAVRETLSLIGAQAQPAGASQTSGAPQTGRSGVVPPSASAQQRGKPVIPNLAGSGSSPVKVVPKSIKQLRQLGQEASARK
jgi:hypothetical protein